MSERERWIVYPLLFFALGAAVRDKILHRVDAKEIYCESLKIIDQHDPFGQAYVELSVERKQPNGPQQSAEQHGILRLLDKTRSEICQLDNSSLSIIKQEESGRQEACQIVSDSVSIASQQKSGKQAFAELGIQQAKDDDPLRMADEVGTLRLVDSDGRVVCNLDENAILQRLISKRLDIVDDIGRVRAIATTEPAPMKQMPDDLETVATQGVIWLNNERVISKLTAPAERRTIPTPKP